MQSWLVVEYLAHGDTARWQAVSHIGSHGLPAAPMRYETEAAARGAMADLAAAHLSTRLVRVWPDGGREVQAPGAHRLEHARPAPLETKVEEPPMRVVDKGWNQTERAVPRADLETKHDGRGP